MWDSILHVSLRYTFISVLLTVLHPNGPWCVRCAQDLCVSLEPLQKYKIRGWNHLHSNTDEARKAAQMFLLCEWACSCAAVPPKLSFRFGFKWLWCWSSSHHRNHSLKPLKQIHLLNLLNNLRFAKIAEVGVGWVNARRPVWVCLWTCVGVSVSTRWWMSSCLHSAHQPRVDK